MTDNNQSSQSDGTSPPDQRSETFSVETPGETLRKAREAAGLSQREVADKLHVLSRHIDSLECDRFNDFNGDIFCKGYIRAYGKLFDLDVVSLNDRYLAMLPTSDEISAKLVRTRHVQQPGKGRGLQYWGAFASLLVVMSLWISSEETEVEVAKVSLEQVEAPIVDGNNRSQMVALETEYTAAADAITPALALAELAQQPAVSPIEPIDAVVAVVVTETVTTEPVVATADTAIEVASQRSVILTSDAVTSESSLSFRFTGDCWVEVKDRDDNIIFADLKHAEDTLKLSGLAPFRILLGYAPGVMLNYNGESVDIDVNSQTNSARLVIGKS